MEPPSNTNSSWPPTAFTYTTHAPVSWARARQMSSRSLVLCRWYGEALMLARTLIPAAAYPSNGAPGVHASSQMEMPTEDVPIRAMQPAPPGTK